MKFTVAPLYFTFISCGITIIDDLGLDSKTRKELDEALNSQQNSNISNNNTSNQNGNDAIHIVPQQKSNNLNKKSTIPEVEPTPILQPIQVNNFPLQTHQMHTQPKDAQTPENHFYFDDDSKNPSPKRRPKNKNAKLHFSVDPYHQNEKTEEKRKTEESIVSNEDEEKQMKKPEEKQIKKSRKQRKRKPRYISSDSLSSSFFEKLPKPKPIQLPHKFITPNVNETPNAVTQRRKFNDKTENFLKKYEINKKQANENKKHYYGVKYEQAATAMIGETRDMDKLNKIERDLQNRVEQYNTLKTNLTMVLSRLKVEEENIDKAIENNKTTTEDFKAKILLTTNEITEMLKRLHNAKTQLEEYRAEIKTQEQRKRKLGFEKNKNQQKQKINTKKLKEIEKVSNHTKKAYHGVKHKINALTHKIRKVNVDRSIYKLKENIQQENPDVDFFANDFN